MLQELEWGIDNQRFDVVLLGANYLTYAAEPLLKKARAKGAASIAMKTMTIFQSDLNIRDLQNTNTSARQAGLKWIPASDCMDRPHRLRSDRSPGAAAVQVLRYDVMESSAGRSPRVRHCRGARHEAARHHPAGQLSDGLFGMDRP